MIEGKAGVKLISLLVFVLIGLMAGGVLTAGAILLAGEQFETIMGDLQNGTYEGGPGLIRSTLLIQHLTMFILPAIIFGLIWYRKKFLVGFDMDDAPGIGLVILGGAFIFLALPLVNLSFLVNEEIQLPQWAHMFESQANATLENILEMDNFGTFLLNLGLIAFIPAIGEELIFRGIIQKYAGQLVRNPIAGIWIAAFLFSMIHMQFEGFLPRMVLGAILGYLYYWTKSLWIPIFAHFMNNGVQVATLYFSDIDLSSIDTEQTPDLKWWMVIGAIGLMYGVYLMIENQVKKERYV
jgi:membrane protease YdiL (CAAX protease family)